MQINLKIPFLKNKIDDDDEKFESIICSRRLFDDIKLMDLKSNDNHVTERLKRIFTKFGDDVTEISVANSKLPECHFIELLSLHPNVEVLSIYDVNFSTTEKDNVELNLPNLKSFKIQLCNFIIPRTLFRLPNDTLQHLSINNCILDQQTIGKILSNQRQLKELEFDPYYVDPTLMSDLKLTKLKLMSKRHVIPILNGQCNLVSLDLSKAHIGDSEFLAICKMKQLQSLKLWIDSIAWENLENLMNLNQLNELALSYERLEVEYVIMLSKLPLPTITSLKIEFPKLKMLTENFIAIAINCPRIKNLIIKGQSIGVIGTIVQYFKNLEMLRFECDSDSVKVVNFPIDNIFNESLRELYISDNQFNNPAKEHFQSSSAIIGLIMLAMPNLEKFKIVNSVSFDLHDLSDILECNKKLTFICIDDITVNLVFDENFLAVLTRAGKNLNYFELNKISIAIDEHSMRQIMDHQFAYISCKEWKNQVILRNCQWNSIDE